MIKIEIKGRQVIATSPYHPDFAPLAKKIGGTFKTDHWYFDIKDEAAIRSLIMKIYGYEEGIRRVDVRIKLQSNASMVGKKSGVFLAGRNIARAYSKNSEIKYGENIIMLNGDFGSGGSDKNWTTTSTPGIEFLIRNLYFPAFENIKSMYGWTDDIVVCEIVGESIPKEASLLLEKDALEAKLNSLNELLTKYYGYK